MLKKHEVCGFPPVFCHEAIKSPGKIPGFPLRRPGDFHVTAAFLMQERNALTCEHMKNLHGQGMLSSHRL